LSHRRNRGESLIEAFKETVPAFCEAVLSNGHRAGDEWVCANLANDPISNKGSCRVHLSGERAGCFIDFAEDIKGGPLQLWKGIFGVAQDAEVFRGMREWVNRGQLPYEIGVYNPHASVYWSADRSEPLVPERDERGRIDETEKAYAHHIRKFHIWDDLARAYAEGINPYGNRPLTGKEALEAKADYPNRKALHDAYARLLKSLWIAYRWGKISAQTIANREDIAAHLAAYRGLSPEVFSWLIDEGYLGVVRVEWNGKESLQVAFPVFRETVFEFKPETNEYHDCFSAYWAKDFRVERTPWKTLEFLGFHLRWFRGEFGSAEGGWMYWPKGTTSEPLVIGELASAEVVVLAESQWDLFAFADLYGMHRGAAPWAGIATRGASNARKLKRLPVPERATVVSLFQNDEANAQWVINVPLGLRRRARKIIPPAGFKDLNDWVRAVGPSAVRTTLKSKGRKKRE
jgi:hypothetical protein